MNINKWIGDNASSLNGKRIAISGSTGGIGRELCKIILRLGGDIIMLDRSRERALALKKELHSTFPNAGIEYMHLDLEDIACVRTVTDALIADTPDFLILNAGAYHIPRKTCALGYNNILQINYVSPYYMARSLLPSIKARGGRIIAVGSIAHRYSETDDNDYDFSLRSASSLAYGNAKRRLMYSFAELGDGAYIAHPGITFTNITAHYPKLIFAIIKHPMKVIFMKPKAACLSIVKAMFADIEPMSWIGPEIFDIWGRPSIKPLGRIKESERKKISAFAEKCYKEMKASK